MESQYRELYSIEAKELSNIKRCALVYLVSGTILFLLNLVPTTSTKIVEILLFFLVIITGLVGLNIRSRKRCTVFIACQIVLAAVLSLVCFVIITILLLIGLSLIGCSGSECDFNWSSILLIYTLVLIPVGILSFIIYSLLNSIRYRRKLLR